MNGLIRCAKCNIQLHDKCGELDLSTEAHILCPLCATGRLLIEIQNNCYKRQKEEAGKMITFSEKTFQPLVIGDSIPLLVPTVDRGPLDFNKILGVVTDTQNGGYKIGTRDGLINGWFPRTEIQKTGTKLIHANDVPQELHFLERSCLHAIDQWRSGLQKM